jgi:hypothetical protein
MWVGARDDAGHMAGGSRDLGMRMYLKNSKVI